MLFCDSRFTDLTADSGALAWTPRGASQGVEKKKAVLHFSCDGRMLFNSELKIKCMNK